MNRLFRFSVWAALAVSCQAATGACLHCDLPPVEIVGRIVRVALPVAGTRETSSEPEYSWYFEPIEPICIAAGRKSLGNEGVRNARRFEILPPPSGADLGRFLGAKVVLKGSFVPTRLPHYHPLTFSVDSARAAHAP